MTPFLTGFRLGCLAGVWLLIAYFCVASAVFQIRNPKANAWVCWTHFTQAMRMEKLEEFQP